MAWIYRARRQPSTHGVDLPGAAAAIHAWRGSTPSSAYVRASPPPGRSARLDPRHPYGRKRFHDFQTIALNTCNFAELDSIRRFRQTAALSR
ncbi:hypothetical protein [Stenotrophomonas sp.]|uniref:hypothetical protein n=1 Tax=Stenotrophomonas sp. TaxID=69392 RepID=UPI0028AF087F|nr:hypothetical protein [Stenotrophomonas sp.]